MAREYVIVMKAVAMMTTIAIKGGLKRTGGFEGEFGGHETDGAEDGELSGEGAGDRMIMVEVEGGSMWVLVCVLLWLTDRGGAKHNA